MIRHVWCFLIFFYILHNPVISAHRFKSNGGGRAGWGSSGSGNGGFHLSGGSSFHLGLGGLFKGITHALEGGGSHGHSVQGTFSVNGGSGSNSVSAQGSISLKSILTTIFELPIKIPQVVFKFVVRTLWNIVTLNVTILRVPVAAFKGIFNFMLRIFKESVRTILNVIVGINSLNVDIIVGIIERIKSIVAWAIRKLSSAQIFGIETGFDIVSFFKNEIEDTIGGALRFVVWIFDSIGKLWNTTYEHLHVKLILRLPGISNVVGLLRWIRNTGIDMLSSNIEALGRFVDSIIYQHQDFFIPIFRYILNFFLASANAFHQIQDGGEKTGIMATFGHLFVSLGPLFSGYWKIHGIGGQTFGSGEPLLLGGGSDVLGGEYGGKGGSGSIAGSGYISGSAGSSHGSGRPLWGVISGEYSGSSSISGSVDNSIPKKSIGLTGGGFVSGLGKATGGEFSSGSAGVEGGKITPGSGGAIGKISGSGGAFGRGIKSGSSGSTSGKHSSGSAGVEDGEKTSGSGGPSGKSFGSGGTLGGGINSGRSTSRKHTSGSSESISPETGGRISSGSVETSDTAGSGSSNSGSGVSGSKGSSGVGSSGSWILSGGLSGRSPGPGEASGASSVSVPAISAGSGSGGSSSSSGGSSANSGSSSGLNLHGLIDQLGSGDSPGGSGSSAGGTTASSGGLSGSGSSTGSGSSSGSIGISGSGQTGGSIGDKEDLGKKYDDITGLSYSGGLSGGLSVNGGNPKTFHHKFSIGG